MIFSFLIGCAIGAVIGAAIAEIFLYVDGVITSYKVKEEARKRTTLDAINKFLVTQVENTSTGPKIHISGKNRRGETVAYLTVEGGSTTTLSTNQTFYK